MQRRSGYHFLRKKKNEGPYLGALWIYTTPNAKKGPKVKDSKESMEIIEAYDLFRSYNGAAQFVGCSPNTVGKYVQARNAGQLIRQGQYERRPKATDKYAGVIEEAVDKSKAKVRAKAIHVRLVALGYSSQWPSKLALPKSLRCPAKVD